MSSTALQDDVQRIRWFHSIDLGGGLVTPGLERTADRLEILRIPDDLRGKSVLDVGAWDGFFSFEAERRGAARVVAADSFAWNGGNWSSKEGFELARRTLGSSVEDWDVDVLDLSAERGMFDLVLFLGVLYHMRHPLLALERVASVTRHHLILETHVDALWTRRPEMVFYPRAELDHDPTNWWGPNPSAVAAMLQAVGFREVRLVTPDSWPYRAARAAYRSARHLRRRMRDGAWPPQRVTQGRAVLHAFR